MMRYFTFVLLLYPLCLTGRAEDAKTGSIKVVVEGFKHQRGKLRLVLARNATEFKKESEASVTRIVDIKGDTVSLELADIAHGDIAIKVHHDEDGDGKLKTNFIGVPKEPVGMHEPNFPKARAPRFDDAKFKFDQAEMSITIKLR